MNAKDLINVLTNQDIIHLMKELGCDNYIDKSSEIIFPTICHDGKSMKLYYYNENKKFQCYSHCGSMSVYDLIMNVKECNFATAFKFLKDLISDSEMRGYGFDYAEEKIVDLKDIVVPEIDPLEKQFLYDIFSKQPIQCWIDEDISYETQKKFKIRYDKSKDHIIIPHFDWKTGKLIGIRKRVLNEIEAEKYGKYTPLFYDGKSYAHPLGHNLYGLNLTKENIKKYKKVVVFESEKSVLKYETMFPNKNISVSVCGSNFTNTQKKILLNLGVKEIIIALDRQYEDENSEEGVKWKEKINRMCSNLNDLCKCTCLWDTDTNRLLDYKDSPIDKNKYIFKKLLDERKNIL